MQRREFITAAVGMAAAVASASQLAARRVLRGKFAKLHRKVLLLARDNRSPGS